jgi:hypothetical protein
MNDVGITQGVMRTMVGAQQNPSCEIVPVPAARETKIFLGTAPIDCLTIQRLGPNFQCTLVGHGGRSDTGKHTDGSPGATFRGSHQ